MRFSLLIVALVFAVAVSPGCRTDSQPAPTAAPSVPPPRASVKAAAPAATTSELVVRIRKLGGPGGKQVLNRLDVPTTVGDDFNVTEQIGAKQLAFSGKVEDLRDGTYRVHYRYVETSAEGVSKMESLIEMPLDHEKSVGGMAAPTPEGGSETLVIGLARP